MIDNMETWDGIHPCDLCDQYENCTGCAVSGYQEIKGKHKLCSNQSCILCGVSNGCLVGIDTKCKASPLYNEVFI